jgi:hypothetical protein
VAGVLSMAADWFINKYGKLVRFYFDSSHKIKFTNLSKLGLRADYPYFLFGFEMKTE